MVKKLQALKAKKGFTLVELIVVIAIIGVLAAILVPTLMNQVTKANVTSADSTAKELLGTVNTWLVENNTAGGSLATLGELKITGTTPNAADLAARVTIIKTPVSLEEKLKSDYTFDTNMKAKLWIDNTGKAVACQFTAKADAMPTDVFSQNASTGVVTAVSNPWKSNDGKNDGVNSAGIIVGTSPKIATGAAAST